MMLLFLTNVDDNNIMIFCVLILFLPNGDEESVCKLKFYYYDYYFMILTLVFPFVQVPDMSSPGNPMAWIMSVEPLTGANYPQWREKINMGLALFEIDKAITDKRPVEPTLLDIPDDLGADAKADREKKNSKLMSCYEIDKINWERSNQKCLMVIKERISEGIRGAIPECETVVEYLEKVESQFTGSSKAYASSLIKRLVSEKYTGGGV